jgi:tetratricopeptide (TPR) repeat protein
MNSLGPVDPPLGCPGEEVGAAPRPAGADTDRNLLFVVLALQADLIDRERFVRACTLWAACKDQPIAQLLIEQGWLRAEDRADVERLLARKLKQHGGDARASLAEAAGPAERSVLATLGVTPVERSLADLPAVEGVAAGQALDRAGRNLLFEELGRGGMGIVLRGRDPDLGRDVAVKLLHPDARGRPGLERRFVEEAQIAGQLQHPGIAPVYELGRCGDGLPFFTMKLIKGQTLAEMLAARPRRPDTIPLADDLPRFLGIFEQVCQALAYAHARGVIHRDLKPDNVMVGNFGEVQVMDWGLAKVLPQRQPQEPEATIVSTMIRMARTDLTGPEEGRTGVVGTPPFMAPEQARGEEDSVDERADVFGLGGILCAILTGKPPHGGSGRDEVIRAAATGNLDEAFARLASCGSEAELIDLARACLAPRREDRPPNASQVAGRLSTYLAGVQERLRQAGLERAAAEARAEEEARTRQVAEAKAAVERRARRLTLALAVALVGLLAGLGVAGSWYQRERVKRWAALERDVTASLRETEALRERAAELTQNPRQWELTLRAADLALKRAEALVDPDTPLGEQVEEARTALEADQRDRALATRFDEVRIEQSQVDVAQSRFQLSEASPRLEKALRTWGLEVGVTAVPLAVERIGSRGRVVQARVIETLDLCLEYARGAGQRRWLAEVLAGADPDPWRRQVRAALANRDREGLSRLARQVETDRQPPSFLGALAHVLPPPEAIALLRRCQYRHPQDFWVNHDLAFRLWTSMPRVVSQGNRAATEAEKEAWIEAARCYTAAQALRPNNPGVLVNLGIVLHERKDLEGAARAFRRAIELDPSYAMAHYKLAGVLRDRKDLEGAVRAYHKALDLDPSYAPAHVNLGNALRDKKDAAGAIRAYRKALQLEPRFATAHYNLGLSLGAGGDVEGALRAYRKAIELNPRYAEAHNNVGVILFDKGKLKEASAAYRKAIDCDPDLARGHFNLGVTLHARRDLKGAIQAFRKALQLDPRVARVYSNLGAALYDSKDLEGAAQAFRKTLELDPSDAATHTNLGLILEEKKDLQGAIRAFRKAIACNPRLTRAYNNLGSALLAGGDLAGAIRAHRQAIHLAPRDPAGHYNLGNALRARGDVEGAVQAFREATKLDPRDATGHYNLANSLSDRGDREGAVKAYRQALELDPNFAQAYCNLGHTLQAQGRFAAALTALRQGHALGSKRPDWPYRSADWVRHCQRLVDLDTRLPALLDGSDKPRSGSELLALAGLCKEHKQLTAAAVRFYAEAFKALPGAAHDLEAAHRYNAACAAALASAGKGKDAASLDDKERGQLRRQALDWLRAEFDAWLAQAHKDEPQPRAAARRTLNRWLVDPDLTSVRDPRILARLAPAEQQEWRRFWQDVKALLQQVTRK